MAEVIFYGQPGCMPCSMLRMKMHAAGIKYDYKDVRRDPEHQEAMLQASGGRFLTPTIVIGKKVMQNPDLHEVKEALEA